MTNPSPHSLDTLLARLKMRQTFDPMKPIIFLKGQEDFHIITPKELESLITQAYTLALEAAIKTAKEKLWDCASCMSKEDVMQALTSLKPKD